MPANRSISSGLPSCSNDLNRIAADFLARHLHHNPEAEFHKLVCPARRYEIHDTHETASEFLTQIAQGSVESERMDISETAAVNILRVVKKGYPVQPAFLAGFRKRDGKPI